MGVGKILSGINSPTSCEQVVIVHGSPTVGLRLADMSWICALKVHATFVVTGSRDLFDFLLRKFDLRQGGEFGDLGLNRFSIRRDFLDQGRYNAFDRRLGKVPEASQL